MAAPIVEVEQGKLQGTLSEDKQFYIFRGIPYAKPPVGELRFRVPVPPETWKGVRDATKICNACAQFDTTSGIVTGSEDCLYLNVSTPNISRTDTSLLPVMFFLHGGGFVFGCGTDDSAQGADYLVKKNVVVVNINYRLGVLGFLCLDRKDAPGNVGLRDQVEALKWVQKNISKFGGDPNNVTIFGISAGGASVEYLTLSPMTKNLFHKCIAQSGTSLLPWSQNNNVRDLSRKLAVLKGKVVQNDEELLKYLKEIPFDELVRTSMTAIAMDKHDGGLHFGFVPTIEKPTDWEPFLDKSTFDLLSQGIFNKVPYMAGFCTNEGIIMLAVKRLILDKLSDEKNFETYLKQFFGIPDSNINEVATELKSAYLSKSDESDAPVIDFFSDIDFIGGIFEAVSLIAKHNSPVYFYEFSYDGGLNSIKKKLNINRKGTSHGDDSGYVLKLDVFKSASISETDELVRERVTTLWTNFAKYGNPSPTIDNVITTEWKPVEDSEISYLFIDENLTMRKNPYPQRMKLFKNLFENYYKNKKF
ncbi:juvenile hormone esterase-like [Galleria mellonella]|uniref:Carboxylic ester hydrolase n=1 Tax=Galleria mellonella TaxID=7137 RepID=A0A6J1X7C0_GALME|nr:juvenile hormone esterase-like [Galleria mellonella]